MITATDEKATGEESADTLEKPARSPGRRGTTITLPFGRSAVLTAVAIVALLIASVVLGCLYLSARSTIADRDAKATADKRAEKIATDYALGASTVDFHDVKSWTTRLKAGTSPQLAAKFDATAPELEQIVLPLQWMSKATPLSATVTSESGGVYKVNAYLNVNSTSAQTPDGGTTTVTYSLTIDSNSGWNITDVGGLQNALSPK